MFICCKLKEVNGENIMVIVISLTIKYLVEDKLPQLGEVLEGSEREKCFI